MILNEEKNEDTAHWLAELQLYEQQANRLAESLEMRNKEYANAEATLIRRVSDNLNAASRPLASASSTSSAPRGKCVNGVHGFHDKIEAAREALRVSQRNEELTGTALARITSFISLHDGKRKKHLPGLRKAAQCFQHIFSESEKHNNRLKENLKMASEEIHLKGTLAVSDEEQIRFTSTEERMAPHYVETTRMATSILECIAATTVSLRRKEELRLNNRKHFEKAHEAARSQLAKQRDLLKDVERAIETAEVVVHQLQTANSTKERSRDELQEQLMELDNSPDGTERLTAMKAAVEKASTELAVLKKSFEETSTSTRAAQEAEREAVGDAKSKIIALERARETVSQVQHRLMTLKTEKAELQEQIETSHAVKQKHIQEVDAKKQGVQEMQEEKERAEEAKALFEKETEPFYASLREARGKVEILMTQFESEASRKAMLLDKKKKIEENVENLRVNCMRSRNELAELNRIILALRQQDSEASRQLEYLRSLLPDAVTLAPAVLLARPQQPRDGAEEENLRELLALRDVSLMEKARRERRQGATMTGMLGASGEINNTYPHDGDAAENGCVRHTSSSVSAQLPLRPAGPAISASDHYYYEAPHTDVQEFRGTSSVHLPVEARPVSMASQSIDQTQPDHPFVPPTTTVVYTPGTELGNFPPTAGAASSMSPHEDASIPFPQQPTSLSGNEVTETTSTIAHINHRLQEILSRRY
ncbi:hypothetical protein DQ04_01621010 [Trypanosoma grayi]|uniref:hypothetical protein n=1 Tax=Trypanosoma grayi TaxID=71804 RepID=UPI0004F44485|nr:hypothetical protein DQ04_01621010 [Trypanosoma grayi]KEG12548.1 hypothetical protein DQ04_01621010 [Trypanosoma grayi]